MIHNISNELNIVNILIKLCRYMADILPILRKTHLINQSINHISNLMNTFSYSFYKYIFHRNNSQLLSLVSINKWFSVIIGDGIDISMNPQHLINKFQVWNPMIVFTDKPNHLIFTKEYQHSSGDGLTPTYDVSRRRHDAQKQFITKPNSQRPPGPDALSMNVSESSK